MQRKISTKTILFLTNLLVGKGKQNSYYTTRKFIAYERKRNFTAKRVDQRIERKIEECRAVDL